MSLRFQRVALKKFLFYVNDFLCLKRQLPLRMIQDVVDGAPQISKTIDVICFKSRNEAKNALAIYNSNLFNFLFYLISDARHITPRETLGLIKVKESISDDSLLHE